MNCNKKSHFDNSTSVCDGERGRGVEEQVSICVSISEWRGEILLSFTSTKIQGGGRIAHCCIHE